MFSDSTNSAREGSQLAASRLFKKIQMRGARRPICRGRSQPFLPLYVDAKSAERNEAGGLFQQSALFASVHVNHRAANKAGCVGG